MNWHCSPLEYSLVGLLFCVLSFPTFTQSPPSWEFTPQRGDTKPFILMYFPPNHCPSLLQQCHFHTCTTNLNLFFEKDRLISVLCGVVTPMLNPIVHTLSNKDIKEVVKAVGRKWQPSIPSFDLCFTYLWLIILYYKINFTIQLFLLILNYKLIAMLGQILNSWHSHP